MPKIVIFEALTTHQDFVYTLAVLSLKAGYEVTVFVTPNIYECLVPLMGKYHEQVEWQVYDKNDGNREYLDKLEKYLRQNKCVLFVNSLYLPRTRFLMMFARFPVVCPSYLVSGRTYLWFERNRLLPLAQSLVQFFARKIILNKFHGLVIHSPEFFAYLEKKKYRKKVIMLPWCLKDQEKHTVTKAPRDYVTFGIVGSINEYRRDYFTTLEVFARLWAGGHTRFHLKLIGGPVDKYGEQVLARCTELQNKKYPLTFSREFLDTGKFLEEVDDCDCLIAPMKMDYYEDNQSSAVQTEQIRFGKMAIVPAKYRIKELATSTLYFNDLKDLEKLLLDNFCDPANIERLKQEGLNNSRKYEFDNFVPSFKGFINEA
jgi:hypothetical protein